jgi:hypothetical protein
MHDEIESFLCLGDSCYHSFQNDVSFCVISKILKVQNCDFTCFVWEC